MRSWIRLCEHLRPIDEFGTRQIHGKRHADLRESRIHDVFAMRRAIQPALGVSGVPMPPRRGVLPADKVAAVPRPPAPYRRRAAVVTPMVEPAVDGHVL